MRAAHPKSSGIGKLPGVVDDQQHLSRPNRRGNGLLPSCNVYVLSGHTKQCSPPAEQPCHIWRGAKTGPEHAIAKMCADLSVMYQRNRHCCLAYSWQSINGG